MKPKASKTLLRLISARCDMAHAIEAHLLFQKHAAGPLSEHFFCSMVVAYGRPFTENNGLGNIKVEYPQYPDFNDTEMDVRHHRLIDLRNKFLAHSSAEGTRVQIIPPNVENPVTGIAQSDFDHNVGKRMFIKPEYVDWLAQVVHAFKARLDEDVLKQIKVDFKNISNSEPFEIETSWDKFTWS